MPRQDLTGKRIILLGAETEPGPAIASALAAAGAHLALVAVRSDAQSAYAAQRLARRVSAPGRMALHQAIDATNEMAVRVMVRQVGKDLGGVDAAIFCAALGHHTSEAVSLALRHCAREMARSRGGTFVVAVPGEELHAAVPVGEVQVRLVDVEGKPPEQLAAAVLSLVAGTEASG